MFCIVLVFAGLWVSFFSSSHLFWCVILKVIHQCVYLGILNLNWKIWRKMLWSFYLPPSFLFDFLFLVSCWYLFAFLVPHVWDPSLYGTSWYICWYSLYALLSWHTKMPVWLYWYSIYNNSNATGRDICTMVVFIVIFKESYILIVIYQDHPEHRLTIT